MVFMERSESSFQFSQFLSSYKFLIDIVPELEW